MVEQNVGFRFEGLQIWQKSRTFIGLVNDFTEHFPRKEDYALTTQINRAAYSIGLNIAEGAGRNSSKEFIQFLNIARGSLFEVVAGFAFALDRKYISLDDYNYIYQQSEILSKMIYNFRKSIYKKTYKETDNH